MQQSGNGFSLQVMREDHHKADFESTGLTMQTGIQLAYEYLLGEKGERTRHACSFST